MLFRAILPSPSLTQSKSFFSGATAGPTALPPQPSPRTGQSFARTVGSFTTNFSSSTASASASKAASDMQALFDLSMALLGHEIDRIAAWHNPNGVASKVLLHQSEFSFDLTIAPRMDDAAWVRLVDTAWRVAPRLAVKMVRYSPVCVLLCVGFSST